jgi:hypothetical protein
VAVPGGNDWAKAALHDHNSESVSKYARPNDFTLTIANLITASPSWEAREFTTK